jgi:hypothetical protein
MYQVHIAALVYRLVRGLRSSMQFAQSALCTTSVAGPLLNYLLVIYCLASLVLRETLARKLFFWRQKHLLSALQQMHSTTYLKHFHSRDRP